VWRRLRRDKVAIGSGIFIVLLIAVAFGGSPIVRHLVGHGPNDLFLYKPAVNLAGLPANPWTHVQNSTTGHTDVLPLGAANRLGQDELLRLMYGAQISLEVAILSTLGVMFIGVILGASAGYFRGWPDTIISRVTEITMAFLVRSS
jgi:peptide/nickel transport system permease protein